jgi:hypothetical protein
MKRIISESDEEIVLSGQKVIYSVRVSRTARRLRLTIQSSGRLILTQPRYLSFRAGQDFLRLKSDWILSKLSQLPKQMVLTPAQSRARYLELKNSALNLVKDRLEHFNIFYRFEYNNISIRNQATRWGSCSKKRNLNFNYRVIDLEPRVADYIIVHELCHLKEFNHSSRFWSLIAQALPDYKTLRKKIHHYGQK